MAPATRSALPTCMGPSLSPARRRVSTRVPVLDPAWTVSEVGLEDLVLAYMKQTREPGRRNRHLEVQK